MELVAELVAVKLLEERTLHQKAFEAILAPHIEAIYTIKQAVDSLQSAREAEQAATNIPNINEIAASAAALIEAHDPMQAVKAYLDEHLVAACSDHLTPHIEAIDIIKQEIDDIQKAVDENKSTKQDAGDIAAAAAALVDVPDPMPAVKAYLDEHLVAEVNVDDQMIAEIAEKAAALVPAGRDATQIEVLPMIDEAKTYPRGCYATHRGGFWRSFEQTHGLRGWEVLVDGMHSVQREQIDARTYRHVTELSSGKTLDETFTVPTVIYRGVYKHGESYAEGDMVTWGGSLWHCDQVTDEKPGTAAKCWTLCAKKGRDGRNGGDK